MESGLRILTCGGLSIQLGGKAVGKLASRKAELLVVYLARQQRAYRREVLAELLWEERSQSQARANLRVVLSSLRKQLGEYVWIDRNQVGLRAEAEVWLDAGEIVASLETIREGAGVATAEKIDRIKRALDLYQGEFLDGVYVHDARELEAWIGQERRHLQGLVIHGLSYMADQCLQTGEYQAGAVYVSQLVELDPLAETGQRQLMRLLALSGQRAAALSQYERFKRLLMEELGIEPEAETNRLQRQIQTGEQLVTIGQIPAERAARVRLPAYLQTKRMIETPAPIFVRREDELLSLGVALQEAMRGHGQIRFVVGGPGRGKTALLEEFARRATTAHPDLLVAIGGCNAISGVGDPYLPFREAFAMLAGDVEAKWAAGTITREHACRLWGASPLVSQVLNEKGPDMLGVFISGEKLVSRLSIAVPDQQVLLQSLKAMVERQRSAPGDLTQKALYEQYTQVLYEISESKPVLLLLDDLQWADAASISLLFHLGRHLQGHRILVSGAYRPEEVALGRGEGSHPLESVLSELKRIYGDVWIDLGAESSVEGRAFVAEILNSEPNNFSEDFREALFGITAGHPLFTVELLREMQQRGDLLQDENGRWMEGLALDWNVLPARVEGVIEARIGRLEDQLRDILTTASVEGEDFTAQVVAQVQGLSERKLLQQLSTELEKRHRLVHSRGEDRVGDLILSEYRFAHALFQQFLYNGLLPGERRLLHKEIALVLEKLYAGSTAMIQLQLAYHYSQAEEGEKAVPHLLRAGDQARNSYGHQEAVGYYRRALEFQERLEDYEGAALTQMKLGQTHHSAFDYRSANEAYAAGFGFWRQASEKRSALMPISPSQTIKLALSLDPLTLDPCFAYDVWSMEVLRLLFQGLVDYTPGMDLLPGLAQHWEILEGGYKYVFHLREDIYWSDGTPLTAPDFVYAWSRLLDPGIQSHVPPQLPNLFYDIKGARAFHLGERSEENSLGIRASAAYTLEVELEEPTGYFLQLMANHFACPVPRHVVERHGDSWTDVGKLVSNGPYLLESRQHNKSITLVRNPGYQGRFSGNAQRVEIVIISNQEFDLLLSMYQANKLDVIRIPVAEVNRLRRQYPSEYMSTPRAVLSYMLFNTLKAPFDDPRIRRAFTMAIDRELFSQTALRGAGIPAMGGMLPPSIPGYSPEIGLAYDPERAQELMARAGYPGGRGFPVVEVFSWAGLSDVHLEYMVNRWKDVLGIELTWNSVPFLEYMKMEAMKPPHVTFRWLGAGYPDPDNFLRVGFREEWSGGPGEAFDSWIERARRIQDQGERIKLYQQADKMLVEEAFIVPLTYEMGHMLVKPWVKNFPLSPIFGVWFLND
ncbi:MAG TPA: ABC transporter substrate-binding protein, partial [Anaerolineales bacterium]|nr:ABC transporter substrate-binding protein [Anaerolineales bacterium]